MFRSIFSCFDTDVTKLGTTTHIKPMPIPENIDCFVDATSYV